MALIQRYTTELSTQTTSSSTRRIHDETQSVEHILHNVAAIKRQDEDDKRYLHSLNDRLEDLIHSLDELEITNRKLRDDLHQLITDWGIDGGNRTQFLSELDGIIYRLSEQNHRRSILQAEGKIFDEQTQLIERVSVIFIDVVSLYRDKSQIIFDLTHELEDELRKIRSRLDFSNAQLKSYDEDFQTELVKFRSYLAEWSQLSLEKQYLLNDIQSLRERYNLRLAYNQEEIKEWQRLLNRISQESKNYYRDYLETIKQHIQMDYQQMAKDQQIDVEVQLKSRLKEIEESVSVVLPTNEIDERRRLEVTERFDSRLDQSTRDYDRLQTDYRILAEEMQHKRRALQDLEYELRNKTRKHVEQHTQLEYDTNLTRTEYYTMKDELDKLAYQLRFSVEEELKIYEALLNSFQRRKVDRLPIEDSKYRQTTATTQRYTDTISSSGAESTGFRQTSPPLVTETTRIFTSRSNTEDSSKYRPPPTSLETSRSFTSQTHLDDSSRYRPPPTSLETSRSFTSQTHIDDSSRYRPPPPPTSLEASRIFTSQTNISDSSRYRPPPMSTETTRIFTSQSHIDDSSRYRPPPTSLETSRIFTSQSSIDDSSRYRPPPISSETTRIFTTQARTDDIPKYRPPPPSTSLETTRVITSQVKADDTPKYRPPPPPTALETTRVVTSEVKTDDTPKYRPPPLLAETTKTTTTTTKTTKKASDETASAATRVDQEEAPSNRWRYETATSGTTSSTRDESTDRDRSAERTIVPARTDMDRYGAGAIQQSLLDQNRTTTTTTRTTRRVARDNTGQEEGAGASRREQRDTSVSRRERRDASANRRDQGGASASRRDQSGSSATRREQTGMSSDVDETFLQSKIHITRRYKGNVLIKFVDVSGRFVEIENTGNQPRDLTGWYIERTVDGRRVDFTFPVYELPPHTTVRIYGNYHRRSSTSDDQHLQLIAPNFYDWGNGRLMRTELFNRDDIGKALFEQTIRD